MMYTSKMKMRRTVAAAVSVVLMGLPVFTGAASPVDTGADVEEAKDTGESYDVATASDVSDSNGGLKETDEEGVTEDSSGTIGTVTTKDSKEKDEEKEDSGIQEDEGTDPEGDEGSEGVGELPRATSSEISKSRSDSATGGVDTSSSDSGDKTVPSETGVCDVSFNYLDEDGWELLFKTDSGKEIEKKVYYPTENGEKITSYYYADAAKMTLNYKNAAEDSEYLVLLLTDDEEPAEGNIAYIDQKTAGGDGVSFDIYPYSLEENKDYCIKMSTDYDDDKDIAGLTEIATFSYHVAKGSSGGEEPTTIPEDPTVTPKPTDPTVTPKPANPTVTPKPTDPTVTPKPKDPTVTPKPANPTVTPKPEKSNVMLGDINGDGKINRVDSTRLSRYIAHWSGYDKTNVDMKAADINGDGKITRADSTLLSRYIAHWSGYEKYFQ